VTRFARDGEIAAFEILMRRHGPLVWSVCRRLLASDHDAEDAFQATFLVLVRKASSIRKQASVASWLYGVAHRIARRACARARQRFGPELADAASSADVLSEASKREVQTILEEELAQLPERLRAPLLLCCLEGRTKAEAARQLGWREGTLSSRLARGRSQLRIRLIRRGVALSVATLASLLERRAAAVPLNTVVAAMRTVSLYTLGETAAGTAASAPVMALAKGTLQAMFLTKLKIGAALALACGILATGAGLPSNEFWTRTRQQLRKRKSQRPSPNMRTHRSRMLLYRHEPTIMVILSLPVRSPASDRSNSATGGLMCGSPATARP
jgi:polysaccharide export outer membrane protein